MKKRLTHFALLMLLSTVSCGKHKRTTPFEISFWYWHTPFKLSTDDVSRLNQMGVKRLFVRAGTFTHGEPLKLGIPQTWGSSGKPFAIVLVFNFDQGLLTHFKDLPVAEAAAVMANDIGDAGKKAKLAGVQLEGVQFDIDCPTRLLPKYAELISTLKRDIGQPLWQYSATTLSSWLGTSGIKTLAEQVDFLAPQFYEGDVAMTTNQVRPISDLSGLEKGLAKASDLDKPFYAGFASYGHALLYDDRGRLAAVYRGLSPEDALRHPAFRFDSSTPLDKDGNSASWETYMGEDLLSLTAVKPGNGGKGLGYRLKYYLPTPALVTQEMKLLRENAPEDCRGAIFYRMPEESDPMALPLVSVQDALKGQTPTPNIRLELKSVSDPWRKVESGSHSDSQDIKVKILNQGDSATSATPDAVQVLVYWKSGAINESSPGQFDSATLGSYDPPSGSFQEGARVNANAILLKRSRLLPGQSCSAGDIQIEGTAKPSATWHVVGPGGFQVLTGHVG